MCLGFWVLLFFGRWHLTQTLDIFLSGTKKKETKSPIYPVSYLIPIYALFLPRLQHMDSWAFYPTVKNISLSLYYVWNKKEHCYNTLGWDVTSSIENGAEEKFNFSVTLITGTLNLRLLLFYKDDLFKSMQQVKRCTMMSLYP